MKRKLTFRKIGGEYQIFWCGENVSDEGWAFIMKTVLQGKEKAGITLVESAMVEAFPGAPAQPLEEDLEANEGAPAPDLDAVPEYIIKER